MASAHISMELAGDDSNNDHYYHQDTDRNVMELQNDQNLDVIPLDANDESISAMQVINMNTSVVEIQANRGRNRAAYQEDENDSDDPEESFMKSRSNKMPRLHSNPDLKVPATNTKENKSPDNEEEVIYVQILKTLTSENIIKILLIYF